MTLFYHKKFLVHAKNHCNNYIQYHIWNILNMYEKFQNLCRNKGKYIAFLRFYSFLILLFSHYIYFYFLFSNRQIGQGIEPCRITYYSLTHSRHRSTIIVLCDFFVLYFPLFLSSIFQFFQFS